MDKELKDKIMKVGFETEQRYGGCAQCVLRTLSETCMKIDPAVIKSATALMAGGMRTGNSCGAFNGGLMAIATVTGRETTEMENSQAVADTAVLGRKLVDRFMKEYGTVNCRDIQYAIMGKSYRMYDPEDLQRFLNDGGHDDKCTNVVAKAATWVAEILDEAGLL